MPTINRIVISGLVVRDPELKTVKTNVMTKITIASEHKAYSPDEPAPERKEVCYVDATFWGEKAREVASNVIKGSPVVVDGRLKLESWPDKNTGEKRYKHVIIPEEIIFGDDALAQIDSQPVAAKPVAKPQVQAGPPVGSRPTFAKPTQPPAFKHPRLEEEPEFNDLPF